MESTAYLPGERSILPPFSLPDEQGRMVDVEKYRQQRNLVIILAPAVTPGVEELLEGLATAAGTLAAEEAVVLTVIQGSTTEGAKLKNRLDYPYPLLLDEGGDLVRRFSGATASVYITDRFREIFAVRHGDHLFSRDEVLEWLAHINRQCPE